MENDGAKFYTKTAEDLELEFEANKKINAEPNIDPEAETRRQPENMIEYFEQLIIENIRSIKFLEKENIPADIKSHRLQYLENHQQMLLDYLDELKTPEP